MVQREVSNLDPVIAVKLAEFRSRRRRLLCIQLATIGIISFFGTLAAVTVVDWLFLLPDWARWVSAALVYSITVFAVIRTGIGLSSHRSDEDTARQVEVLKPELREHLIAAVELGKGSSQRDSPIFRQLLQKQVAAQLRDLDIATLLPWTLVKHRVRWSIAIVSLAFAFSFFPDSPGRILVVRALSPRSNLPRISQTRIKVLVPEQADAVVPRGDSINVVIALTGTLVRHAILQYRSVAGHWQNVEMTQTRQGEFSANVPIAGEPLEYRLRAGDGISGIYTLNPKPRPHVIRFEKIYHYPRYAGLEPIQKIENAGDISGLEGSEVDLRLQLDQPVSRAELEILSPGNSTNVLSLKKVAENLLAARVPLIDRQTYRVRLISEQTGFENKFSPQYEIRPVPDLPPTVRLTAPAHDLAAAPDAWIEITGEVTDDLPLVNLSQEVRVNNGVWSETSIPNPTKTNGIIQIKWDLIGLNLSAGDYAETKILAVDLKGARVETPPIHVTIISKTLDLKRMQVVEQHRRIASALGSLRASAEVLARSFLDAAESLRAEDADLEARQIALKLSSQCETFSSRITEVLDFVRTMLPQSRGGYEAAALIAVGNSLLEMRYHGAGIILQSLNDTGLAPEGSLRQAALVLRKLGSTGDFYNRFLTEEQVGLHAENLSSLLEEQRQILAGWAGDDQAKDRIKRREAAATRSLKLVEQTITNSLASAGADSNSPLDSDPALKSARLTLETKIRESAPITTNQVTEYRNAIEQALGKALLQYANISKQLKWEEISNPVTLPANLQSDYWDSLANLEESRCDSDAQFVADLSGSAQALREALSQASTNAQRDELEAQIRQALKVCLTENEFGEIVRGLQALRDEEAWEMGTIRARTDHPFSWFLLKQVADRFRLEFQLFGLSNNPLIPLADPGQNTPAGRIEAEMRQRSDPRHLVRSIASDANALLTLFKEPLERIGKLADTARQRLLPSNSGLSLRIQLLASMIEDLQSVTLNAITNGLNEIDATRELLARQRKSNQQLDRIRAELRHRASLHETRTLGDLERVRDYDDAVTLLIQPPVLAERALQEAIDAHSTSERGQNFELAAAQLDKIARLLHRLAGHFQYPQPNIPDSAREALRQSEDLLGIKSDLDQRYAVARILAECGPSPSRLPNKLEEALKTDRAMQQELRTISKSAMATAEQSLMQGVKQELAIVDLLQSLTRKEAASRAGLGLETQKVLEEMKKSAGESLANLHREASAAPQSMGAIDNATKSLAAVLEQPKLESGGGSASEISQIKKRIELIEGARLQVSNVERVSADARGPALKFEQDLALAAGKLETKLHEVQTALLNDRTELSRIETQQQKLNTEELQHFYDKFQEAVTHDESAIAAARALFERAQNDVKTAHEAAIRLEMFHLHVVQATEQIALLRQRFQNIHNSLQKLGQETQVELTNIAAHEEPVRKLVLAASGEVSRAFRHYYHLQHLPSSQDNRPLAEFEKESKTTVNSIQALEENQVPLMQKTIEQSGLTVPTQTLVENLADQFRKEAVRLHEIQDAWSAPETSGDRSHEPVFDLQSKWMARLLDASQGVSGISPGQEEFETTFQAALQSSRATLANVRANMTHSRISNSVQTRNRSNDDWRGIPSRFADDLFQSRHETVSPQYQAMVDSYFKAIADKARQALP
ncbi:MAG: IgA-specific metalloendopeptidase [Verrucomicrobiales bacterium]|nr:IgA-specific metalloendopeptidase [Verrucomicrobiales bacterium]